MSIHQGIQGFLPVHAGIGANVERLPSGKRDDSGPQASADVSSAGWLTASLLDKRTIPAECVRLISAWWCRSAVCTAGSRRSVSTLDDHTLADIGLLRAHVMPCDK